MTLKVLFTWVSPNHSNNLLDDILWVTLNYVVSEFMLNDPIESSKLQS